MNNAGTTEEFKSLLAGAGISVSCTTGNCTVTQTVFPPAGSLTLFAGTVAPSGWLLCDGTAQLANTYPNLAAVLIPNASTWGRGTAVGAMTCNTGTDICTVTNNGLVANQIIHFASTVTLPAPLTDNSLP